MPAVNCEWNDWQIGECSEPCGGGIRTNSRTKKIEESNGTDEDGVCEGEATMEEECNTQTCPRKLLSKGYLSIMLSIIPTKPISIM